MSRLYRSRPTEVEAVRWTGTEESAQDLADFSVKVRVTTDEEIDDLACVLLAGKEGAQGWVPVPIGHWVVRNPGDESDYWPVENEFFLRKYELAGG